MNTVIREVVLIPQASNTECCKSEIHFKTTDLQNLKTNQMKLTLDQEQLARIKSLDSDKKRKEFFLTAIIENIIRESKEFISPEKEYKVKVEIVKDEKLKGTGYENSFFKVTIPIGTPIQDSLNAVDEFFKQKTEIGNKIISEEKAKEIVLNNEYLQKVLSETHDVKFFRDLQNICVKRQNYEYASKFRQKVRDILVTLSTEKLIELVQDGTIELIDMARAVGRKKDKSANNNPKQFTLEDMRKIYVNGILDNQNLLVTPETCQITFDMHLRNVEKKQ